MNDDVRRPLGIQSVEVAAEILAALANETHPMTLKELSQATGMPMNKVHRYLVSLTRTGLLKQEERKGAYAVGPLSMRLGLAGLAQVDMFDASYRAVHDLRARINRTVALSIMGERGPTVVYIEESDRPVTISIRPGSILPPLRSSSGLVFAAYLPHETVVDWLAREQPDVALDEIAPQLAEVREHGMARVAPTMFAGVCSVGAPVFDFKGGVVAALIAIGLDSEMDPDFDGPTGTAVKDAARELSVQLGHRRAARAAE